MAQLMEDTILPGSDETGIDRSAAEKRKKNRPISFCDF